MSIRRSSVEQNVATRQMTALKKKICNNHAGSKGPTLQHKVKISSSFYMRLCKACTYMGKGWRGYVKVKPGWAGQGSYIFFFFSIVKCSSCSNSKCILTAFTSTQFSAVFFERNCMYFFFQHSTNPEKIKDLGSHLSTSLKY